MSTTPTMDSQDEIDARNLLRLLALEEDVSRTIPRVGNEYRKKGGPNKKHAIAETKAQMVQVSLAIEEYRTMLDAEFEERLNNATEALKQEQDRVVELTKILEDLKKQSPKKAKAIEDQGIGWGIPIALVSGVAIGWWASKNEFVKKLLG